jgi:hypothetical protein
MTEKSKSIFAATSTCGYVDESGSWSIYVDIPQESTPIVLNPFSQRMVLTFLDAFHALCRVTQARYDILSLKAEGKPNQVLEGETISIHSKDHENIWQELETALPRGETSYFTRIILVCDMNVFIPDSQNNPRRAWVSNAAEFYFGYVLEFVEKEKLMPVDGGAKFTTHIDVWAEKTIDPATLQWRDNRKIARTNQSLLEEPLKKWERLTGKPIIDTVSQYYSAQIFRYGFRTSGKQE